MWNFFPVSLFLHNRISIKNAFAAIPLENNFFSFSYTFTCIFLFVAPHLMFLRPSQMDFFFLLFHSFFSSFFLAYSSFEMRDMNAGSCYEGKIIHWNWIWSGREWGCGEESQEFMILLFILQAFLCLFTFEYGHA